jgi:glycosyltransferase involved in cell wall biosynthesis
MGGSEIRSVAIRHLPDVSGPSRSLENELKWLADQGELEVFVPGDGRLEGELDRYVRVRRLAYSTLAVPNGTGGLIAWIRGFWRDLRTLRTAIRDFDPDFVIVTSALLYCALLAASSAGVRSILYAGEILDEPRVATGKRALAGKGLLRLVARSATTIITCSDRVSRQYIVRGAKHVTTISPPIGSSYADGDGERFRRTHGIPADVPLIVAVGAITHSRGQDTLVHALPAIRRLIPDAHLAIVGEPHPREVDREYARSLARFSDSLAPGAVTFTGFEEHMGDAYAASSVVVNPTRYEAFGRVAFEALRAGRPVVATSVGAVPEVLRDGVDALLVPSERPGALARAIATVLTDDDLARRLVDSGGARARAELCPSASLAAFSAEVNRLVEPPTSFNVPAYDHALGMWNGVGGRAAAGGERKRGRSVLELKRRAKPLS